ncbi:MAG: leucine-rich repeat domain-containing protein [Bacteroidetes bacterium]|nr:leucine-rich repeat domain-containing protein [Bacteroidota bacterium]
MDIDNLYRKLKEAYTEETLNKISSGIIRLYKNKEYDAIRSISGKIRFLTGLTETRINKIFSKLITLYHPDKLNHYLRDIEKFYREKNQDRLFLLSHILLVINWEKDTPAFAFDFNDLYPSGQQWGIDEDDFALYNEFDPDAPTENEMFDPVYFTDDDYRPMDFLTAVKRKEYGALNIEFEYYNLSDIGSELELTQYGIEDLYGIHHCRHLITLDLSHNRISDLMELHSLKQLEELYLSDNHISDIGILKKLENLRIIDLSDNDIDDLSPLYELEKLEYVNVMANRFPLSQVGILEERGVVVVY